MQIIIDTIDRVEEAKKLLAGYSTDEDGNTVTIVPSDLPEVREILDANNIDWQISDEEDEEEDDDEDDDYLIPGVI
jgi:hypothetical protein